MKQLKQLRKIMEDKGYTVCPNANEFNKGKRRA
jgi:hypothetical protein